MARTVKAEEHTAKRDAILDTAQELVELKGYERMAIQEILDLLQISKGAFYHYFDSKPALLLALVERRGNELEQVILPIIHDQSLSAVDKLQRYFTTHNSFKLGRQQFVLELTRAWYADENAIVRSKLSTESRKRLIPWLSQIIAQGVEEGSFTTSYPLEAARIIVALLETLGDTIAEVLLSQNGNTFAMPQISQATIATADAVERVLGLTAGYLQGSWQEALAQWRPAANEHTQATQSN